MSAATLVLTVLVGMLATISLAWLFQRLVANTGRVDVFWTFGAGIACVIAALWPDHPANPDRQMLVAALAAAWSLLGLYVAFRVARSAERTFATPIFVRPGARRRRRRCSHGRCSRPRTGAMPRLALATCSASSFSRPQSAARREWGVMHYLLRPET